MILENEQAVAECDDLAILEAAVEEWSNLNDFEWGEHDDKKARMVNAIDARILVVKPQTD